MFFRQVVCKLSKGFFDSAVLRTKTYNYLPNGGKLIVPGEHDFRGHTWSKYRLEVFQWVFLSGQAAIILGACSSPSVAEDVSTESTSKNVTSTSDFSGLRKIEDASMISNEHTSKWRVFTDNGRDYFLKGNIEQAEKFFVSALQEARKGFGERDPHVASACNNLAELFKVRKDFDKAEPLYLEAINILEEHFGINDIRVGAALHNLGQFYHAQRKLEKAHGCYEIELLLSLTTAQKIVRTLDGHPPYYQRSLKIKRRVLGEAHSEYADTMYHLGTVLYLEGKEKDGEDLIVDSIQILEAGGQGESILCIRRMQYLAQMYTKSNRFAEAEILLRKTLHIMEVSKGWRSLDTVVLAERLALALEATGRLGEAEELLERCLDARKTLLPHEHIQSAANMLYIARVKMLISDQQLKTNSSQAIAELDKAKSLLQDSVRVAQKLLVRFVEQKGTKEAIKVPIKTGNNVHSAAVILLQSLNALGSLETMKQEFLGSKEHNAAEAAFRQCISTFRELGPDNSDQVKAEYLSCLRSLYHLISNVGTRETCEEKEIKDEIQSVEGEVSKSTNA